MEKVIVWTPCETFCNKFVIICWALQNFWHFCKKMSFQGRNISNTNVGNYCHYCYYYHVVLIIFIIITILLLILLLVLLLLSLLPFSSSSFSSSSSSSYYYYYFVLTKYLYTISVFVVRNMKPQSLRHVFILLNNKYQTA